MKRLMKYFLALRKEKLRAYINNLIMKITRSPEKKFEWIYKSNIWNSHESRSGPGSELAYTKNLRDWLPVIIEKYRLKKIVDAPCGDFNWMKVVIRNTNIDYHGIDIVQSIIDQNIRNYSSDRIRFKVGNICSDRLPDCDLLIVRDCLFHLSYADIAAFLRNISIVNYRYLLTTTHKNSGGFVNTDIVTGGFRKIDIFSEPFRFFNENVIERVDDYPTGYPIEREMILFEKKSVPNKLK